MHSFWRDITAVAGQRSFSWTVLFVVSFGVIMVLFGAPVDMVIPIVGLGCIGAIAEHVMRDQNSP